MEETALLAISIWEALQFAKKDSENSADTPLSKAGQGGTALRESR